MKYNLKNRPKYDGSQDCRDLCEEWFVGFEAELREMLKHGPKFYGSYRAGREVILREVLGE